MSIQTFTLCKLHDQLREMISTFQPFSTKQNKNKQKKKNSTLEMVARNDRGIYDHQSLRSIKSSQLWIL